ncbi:hypothetical protein LOAG_16161 [Loa loa]|uniref:Uncharacterized protein n=1 Tax=Loa loa TaxID=7209 RepID=A0A1S0TES5_LOALO|nr:hypothetical protein LOAG_16161 [Loa loa]EFO12372.1 hypothetical protein LOAG_16161 [Loa loa]
MTENLDNINDEANKLTKTNAKTKTESVSATDDTDMTQIIDDKLIDIQEKEEKKETIKIDEIKNATKFTKDLKEELAKVSPKSVKKDDDKMVLKKPIEKNCQKIETKKMKRMKKDDDKRQKLYENFFRKHTFYIDEIG